MSRKKPTKRATALKRATASLKKIKECNPSGFLALARLIEQVEKTASERAA